jgi:hypothetical protein
VDNKRIAAVVAALHHMEAQIAEAAAGGTPQGGAPRFFATGAGPVVRPWALYGRQRIMNMRALMQSRVSSRRV